MEKQFVHPKNTFLNLPEAKQQRILAAAVAEFSANGYQKASLNTIVRRLDIAKGAVYRYFDSKEVLFLYVFDQFTRAVKQTVHNEIAGIGDDDFFAVIRAVLMAGLNFIDRYPEYFRIYLRVLFEGNIPRRGELIARVRLFSHDYFGPLCDRAKQQGLIRTDIPTPTICFMIDSIMDRFLQGYARPGLDGGLELAGKSRQEVMAEADLVIKVVWQGIGGGE